MEDAVENFKNTYGSLMTVYQSLRHTAGNGHTPPDGSNLTLSLVSNQLQAQVIEQFAPQFLPIDSLYLETQQIKTRRDRTLIELGIPVTEHDKLPDIILYLRHNWLYLIEVVTSHGPMTPKRLIELNEMLRNCIAGKIFVTAFPSFAEFRKHIRNIAWETEVWIAEVPDHLIHFNGDRFLGPRQ
jgi:type II restriction enzyme